MAAPPVPGHSAGSGSESFSGPYGPGAQHTGWDGAMLELRADGRFVLELWRFWEQWGYLPEDQGEVSVNGPSGMTGHAAPASEPSPTAKAVEKFSNGNAGLRVREVEEVRAIFEGQAVNCLKRREAPAVHLKGLGRPELNQAFMADADREVDGQPTWWSEDGRYFLYFVQEDQHWKVNAVRLASGDGLRNVRPGARRAGRGWAHSGPAQAGETPDSALFSGEGWFECVEDEWEPIQVQPRKLPAWEFTFCADNVVVEERHARGEDSTTDRQVGSEIAFQGWRHSPMGGEVRLVLPPLPDRHVEGDIDLGPVLNEPPAAEGATNFLGDPEVIVLRPTARL